MLASIVHKFVGASTTTQLFSFISHLPMWQFSPAHPCVPNWSSVLSKLSASIIHSTRSRSAHPCRGYEGNSFLPAVAERPQTTLQYILNCSDQLCLVLTPVIRLRLQIRPDVSHHICTYVYYMYVFQRITLPHSCRFTI